MSDDLDRIKAKLNALPADKKSALIVNVEWNGNVPTWGRVSVVTRVGEHFQFGAETEDKFKSGTVYAALVW